MRCVRGCPSSPTLAPVLVCKRWTGSSTWSHHEQVVTAAPVVHHEHRAARPLEMGGELDLGNVHTLRDHLDLVVDAGTGNVDVDMTQVSFSTRPGLARS